MALEEPSQWPNSEIMKNHEISWIVEWTRMWIHTHIHCDYTVPWFVLERVFWEDKTLVKRRIWNEIEVNRETWWELLFEVWLHDKMEIVCWYLFCYKDLHKWLEIYWLDWEFIGKFSQWFIVDRWLMKKEREKLEESWEPLIAVENQWDIFILKLDRGDIILKPISFNFRGNNRLLPFIFSWLRGICTQIT